MTCQECGHKLLCFDTNHYGEEYIRKRKCPKCGAVFYTSEKFIGTNRGKWMCNERQKKKGRKKREM